MFEILGKDTIEKEIIPYLSIKKEDFFTCKCSILEAGGIVVGVTPGSSPSSPSSSTQAVVLLGSGSANQIVNIQDSNNKEVITFLSPVAYSNILISTPNLSKSTTYKLYKSGSVACGEDFNGLYTSGTYSGGTLSKRFTTGSSSYTQVN